MEFIKTIIEFFKNKDGVAIMKDLFNIMFFIVTGCIAVLTYLKARVSVLQPIKTEVFKQQLIVFSEIMEIFNGKDEAQIREFFAFKKIEQVNTVKLIDEYIEHFFEVKFNREERPYNRKECKISMVTQKTVEKYFTLDNEPVREEIAASSNEETNRPNPAIKAAIWQKYEFGIISIPNEFIQAEEKIDRIKQSPLLPKACVKYLSDIQEIAHKNITILRETLEKIAQELPEKYPNKQILLKISTTWISNKYNDEFISFEGKVNELLDYLRDYLKVDNLLE
ncbi:hypothetical protein FDG50_05285 [Clostridium botulinum]|uniref:hypothetical protein n=1 Tax=Clostridium botulinum TaxID=1491 RepID=UPI0014001D7B|nr:hypothetical protein [Clostridium botulinum]MBY6836932.1 hypothetical protein [Clostridium botulinum]NFG59767.1 hypothetical protein [Clostridium botulinum]NFG64895.1 hypothetical protein [Clostridium botulinum]NFQ23556.1 hypothetical protein [Clostridium botulinum]